MLFHPWEFAHIVTVDGECTDIYARNKNWVYENADMIQEDISECIKLHGGAEGMWVWTIQTQDRILVNQIMLTSATYPDFGELGIL